MNKVFIAVGCLAITFFSIAQQVSTVSPSSSYDNLSWWVSAVQTLDEDVYLPALKDLPTQLIPADIVTQKIDAVRTIMEGQLADESKWLGGQRAASLTTPPLTVGGIDAYIQQFSAMANEAFVQTLITPADSKIFVIGDLHGSLKSFVRTLQRLNLSGYIDDNFNITTKNFYMVILGDYTDRGAYATEIIYLLGCLFVQNPEKMFILRGNHEDIKQHLREATDNQGFPNEIEKKYTDDVQRKSILETASYWYSRLPVALYLGSGTDLKTDFVQLSHGGIEPGFDPRPLFAFADHQDGVRYQAITCTDKLKRRAGAIRSQLFKLSTEPTIPCGFTWGDFSNATGGTGTDTNRGYHFKTQDAIAWMHTHSDSNNVWHAIIRGHQHNPEPLAKGVTIFTGCNVHTKGGMWPCADKGIDVSGKTEIPLKTYPIYTLISAPGFLGINSAYDSFAIIKTAQQFDDWTIRLAQFRPTDTPQELEDKTTPAPKYPRLVLAPIPINVPSASLISAAQP